MNNSNLLSYEEAVKSLGSDPSSLEIIKLSYLDEFPPDAWNRFLESEEWKELTRLLPLTTQAKLSILDLGAGNGIVSHAFTTLGHLVVSVDPNTSERVGLRALASKEGLLNSVCSFAEALPFQSSSFDIVYCRQTLHHLHDLSGGIKEIARVLKPGGTFLASRDHVVSNDAERKVFLETHPLHKLHGGEWAYTSKEYRDAIKLAGLSIIREIKPYDSVINHFPFSNDNIEEWLRDGLSKRFGKFVASKLTKRGIVKSLYRKFLSSRISVPGRLYSWLCTKGA